VLKELERVKREKEAASTSTTTTTTTTRRWDDDVIFRNNAKNTNAPKEKRFINDTVRSDTHKDFLKKYIR
jgi:protein CWC15